jgi:hypothetical protein
VVFEDLEDVVGGWHLQDYVPIMGNYHKLVQGRPAQNGIEGETDLRDVEQDTFREEVLRRPECDREGDTSALNDRYRAHLREWARQLELQHRYLQLFESYQADKI